MANGLPFPYGFQQGNLLTAQRPPATSFYQAAQQGRFGLPKPYEPQSSMLAPTMAAIQARTPTSTSMPAAPLARSRLLQEQLIAPQTQSVAPKAPSGLDQLRAAQLRMPAKGTPQAAGLAAAGRQLLAAGGWQDRPVTLGQTLASGLQAYTEAEQAAADRQAAAQQQALANQLAIYGLNLEAQKAMQPDLTTAEQNALAMGLKRGTPEFNDFIMRSATKPPIAIDFGGSTKQQEMAYAEALRKRKEIQDVVAQTEAMTPRLMLAIDLLDSGVETGRVESALLPVKQWMKSLNLLSDEQIENLTAQELIDSATAALTPAQRVAGSGTTSDRDMAYYQRATVNMANTPEANRVIAAMQLQLNKYNKKRLKLLEDYILDKGHDFGFGDYADKELGSIYQRVESQEQGNQLIKDGLLQEGDVFYNAISGEFDIFSKEGFQ